MNALGVRNEITELLGQSSDWCGCWEGDLHKVFEDHRASVVEGLVEIVRRERERAVRDYKAVGILP